MAALDPFSTELKDLLEEIKFREEEIEHRKKEIEHLKNLATKLRYKRTMRRLAAQRRSKRPAAQDKVLIPRVTTFCPIFEFAQEVKEALLDLGIPVFKVKPLIGAKKGVWLIFLDVHADFTEGTFIAEWLTAVCKGEPSANIRCSNGWTLKFSVFIKEGDDDQAHAELWRNGTFPREAPSAEERSYKEPVSEELASE